ncbi:amidohydrolase [Vogesella sp. LIG4]|uniref:amidohydrolase n=1 Tax=Vogesella sp. LIG4 TaxID=1192162 RepID=UPI00081FE78F|nr:amidohydrolase [Vogesella sp. LIG4]SCK25626.1 hypothetical protein PSELUDRAFT_3057 [Vogesella sp. LIG4]
MDNIADTLYLNGSIYTGDAARNFAQALAVRDGKVLATGSSAALQQHHRGTHTRVVDLAGRLLLPAFIDGHVHPMQGQQILGEFDLSGLDTPDAILARIRACAAATPDAPWVYLGGANLAAFGAYPTRQQLDAAVPDRPLLVTGFDVHSGCINSKGLALAGITAATPDPQGGIIERDADGAPSGVLHEEALYLVFRQIPQLSAAGYPAALAKAQRMAYGYGITGWFDAWLDEPMIQAYWQAQQQGELKVYMSAGMVAQPGQDAAEQIERFVGWQRRYQHDNLRLHTVKIFIDGVPESKTAALLAPYQGTEELGMTLWTQQQLDHISLLADRAGFDLHFHTLGDRAVRMALDALEHVQRHNPARERRAQLAHVQLIDPADYGRFHQLGAIASVQCLWTAATPAQLQQFGELFGAERLARNYPFRSLRNAGAMLAGGSDWSVSSMNPLEIIETGVTHLPPGASDGEPWNPHERLDVLSLLEAHTVNAAWALRFDDCAGSLQAGKDASFSILDRNPLLCPVAQFSQARVVQTCFRGEVVYQLAEQA